MERRIRRKIRWQGVIALFVAILLLVPTCGVPALNLLCAAASANQQTQEEERDSRLASLEDTTCEDAAMKIAGKLCAVVDRTLIQRRAIVRAHIPYFLAEATNAHRSLRTDDTAPRGPPLRRAPSRAPPLALS